MITSYIYLYFNNNWDQISQSRPYIIKNQTDVVKYTQDLKFYSEYKRDL